MTEKADILFDPTFSPVDNASREIVLGIAEELNLTLTSKKSEKVVVILSSLLWACQKIRRDGGKANLIGWSHDDSYWVEYPAVGKRVVNEVRQALVDNGWLTLHTPAAFKSTMTVYQIDESVFTHEGRWVQSEKPTIIVKSAKTKFRSSGSTIGGEKMTPTKAKKEFGSKYSEQQSRLEKLKEYWKIHPLIIDDDRYCSATRIFNDDRMDRGGDCMVAGRLFLKRPD